MSEFFDQIPANIQPHLKEILKTSGLPDGEESLDKIAGAWLEKKKIFEEEVQNLDMEERDILEKEEEKGALALTYSGSLINIGPNVDGKRKVSYASIGMRSDVPALATDEESTLANDIVIDKQAEFAKGPIKKSSPIFKIAVCREEMSAKEEEQQLNQATMIIMDNFVEVNKTVIDE
jgi:hypothetical protein